MRCWDVKRLRGRKAVNNNDESKIKARSRITPEIVARIEDFLEERKLRNDRREAMESLQNAGAEAAEADRRSGNSDRRDVS